MCAVTQADRGNSRTGSLVILENPVRASSGVAHHITLQPEPAASVPNPPWPVPQPASRVASVCRQRSYVDAPAAMHMR